MKKEMFNILWKEVVSGKKFGTTLPFPLDVGTEAERGEGETNEEALANSVKIVVVSCAPYEEGEVRDGVTFDWADDQGTAEQLGNKINDKANDALVQAAQAASVLLLTLGDALDQDERKEALAAIEKGLEVQLRRDTDAGVIEFARRGELAAKAAAVLKARGDAGEKGNITLEVCELGSRVTQAELARRGLAFDAKTDQAKPLDEALNKRELARVALEKAAQELHEAETALFTKRRAHQEALRGHEDAKRVAPL